MTLEDIGSLEVVKYKFEIVNREPKIVISMIKVLDKEGKYIKFAKMSEIETYLHQFKVTFKPPY